jgi:hypothetical protein
MHETETEAVWWIFTFPLYNLFCVPVLQIILNVLHAPVIEDSETYLQARPGTEVWTVIPWNRFLGSLEVLKYRLWSQNLLF